MQDNSTRTEPYSKKIFFKLIAYAKPYKWIFVLCFILIVFSTFTEVIRPYFFKLAIDDYISKSNITNAVKMSGLMKLSILFLITIVGGFIISYLQTLLLSYAGQSIIFNIRQHIFTHLQKLPVGYFDKNATGQIVTRVSNDTEVLNSMYTNVIVDLAKDFLILAGIIIIMFTMDVKLTLISLTALPIVVAATVFFGKKIRVVYRRTRSSLSKINASLSENISGIKVIQIFNVKDKNFKEFEEVNEGYFKSSMKELMINGTFRPAIDMLSSITIAIIIWYGGGRIIGKELQFGVLLAFINYISMLFQPIRDLSEKYDIIQSSLAASERVFHLLEVNEETDEGKSEYQLKETSGEIEFKNVWFKYNENSEYVLKDVNFKVEKGKTYAIVGASGAGKTSIINLISRFYEFDKGEILIDGKDIKTYTKESLRENICIVPQDVFLFSDTIIENIKLRGDMEDEKVIEIAKYVNADKFIEKFDKKYDELLGENGNNISTGQRQLLAFARVLTHDHSVLILDEATSNIDSDTEELINDALGKVVRDKTTLIIAHRFSTIKAADKIIVMHKGRVREIGTHEELLNNGNIYSKLYNLQLN